MEWHRVKTILLSILAVVNGMLLLLVWNQRAETLRYEKAALDGAIQVLAENGISLDYQAVEGRECYLPESGERDISAEAQIAAVLLGEEARGENRGGGLYTYSTRLGELSFRPGGILAAELTDAAEWRTDHPEEHADSLMSSLSVSVCRVKSELSAGSGTVWYMQVMDGIPVFSCQVALTYEAGLLRSISGTLLAMTGSETGSGEPLTLPTVLMRFLDEVLETGDVCSAILEVEPGYLVTQSFSNAIQLRPTWYITTNTGDYYVDGISGELTRVTDT